MTGILALKKYFKKLGGISMLKKYQFIFLCLILIFAISFGVFAAEKYVIRVGHGAGDPLWEQMVSLYENIRPDVDIKLDTLLPAPEGYQQLATQFSSGNTWDIVISSEAYIMAVAGDSGEFDLSYLVDLSPYITKQERKDFGEEILNNTTYIGRYQGLPIGACPGWSIMAANKKMFQDAGIDYKKIQETGWTWDDFINVCNDLTKPDENQYAFATSNDAYGTFIWPAWLTINNGVPYTHVTYPMYDNEFKYYGEGVLGTLEFMHRVMYEEKITPPGMTGMSNSMVQAQLFDGKIAMMPGLFPAHANFVREWNSEIAAGLREGKPSSVEIISLPYPHKEGKPEHVLPRTQPLWVMKQKPYKGDEHLEEVIKFAKFIASPVISAVMNNQGTIPARESTFKVRPELALDDNVKFMMNYYKRAGLPWAPRHPGYKNVMEDEGVSVWTMWKEVFHNTKKPEEAYGYYMPKIKDKWEKWLKNNKESAKLWARDLRPTEKTMIYEEFVPEPVKGVDN